MIPTAFTVVRSLPRLVLALWLVSATLLGPGPAAPIAAQDNPRFFPDTGFTIANDRFWDYFQKRGGTRTFGLPISRELQLEGFRVQFFQRQVMQQRLDGSVQLLNLLDPGVVPYTRMNGSTFPAVDENVLNGAPSTADPQYADKVVQYVRDRAPDQFGGKPVNFGTTAVSLVRYEEAFPEADAPSSLVPVISVLEITGLPTSQPAADPNNNDVIYQRFQRVILQYDAKTNQTQVLLLADYLKAILTGQNLPADLEEQARTSRYYRQYDRRRDRHVARADQLPASDLTNAFEREDRALPPVDFDPRVVIEVTPAAPVVGATFVVTVTATDDNGVKSLSWNAVGSGVPELDAVKEADCGGVTSCVRSWNAVTRVPGTLNFRAVSVDTANQSSPEARAAANVANTLQGALEAPEGNAKVGGTVTIRGWVADKAASSGTGIQAVHVYLDGEQGQGFFVGAADYGVERDDIARTVYDGEERFRKVGFRLEWDTAKIAPGEHTLYVYALSAATGRWQRFTSKVQVVARPWPDDPLVSVIEPEVNATVSGTGKTIRGWAIDRNASSGTGIDRVEVWLDGERNQPGVVKLGEVQYGQRASHISDVTTEARYQDSGFSLVWNPDQFRRGEHTLYVYARSTHTDTWVLRKVPIKIE